MTKINIGPIICQTVTNNSLSLLSPHILFKHDYHTQQNIQLSSIHLKIAHNVIFWNNTGLIEGYSSYIFNTLYPKCIWRVQLNICGKAQ